MSVLGDVFLNFIVNEIKAFSAAPGLGADAVNKDLRLGYQLSAGSSPPIDEVYHESLALTAGTLTFSLESLTRTNQSALDLTGLEAIWLVLHNPVGNAQMTIEPGDTNAYPFIGATYDVVIQPGGLRIFYEPAGFGVVSTTVSDIKVTGTGSQVFEIMILAGDLT